MNTSVSAQRVAQCCDVPLSVVIEWIESGIIPAFTLEGREGYFIHVDDFLAFFAQYTSHQDYWAVLAPIKSVLLIEPDLLLASQLKQLLMEHGYLVMQAQDISQLLDILPQNPPHLVSIHQQDSSADTLEAMLHVFQRVRPKHKAKIILITDQCPPYGFTEHVDAVLLQPFLMDEYLDSVRRVMQS